MIQARWFDFTEDDFDDREYYPESCWSERTKQYQCEQDLLDDLVRSADEKGLCHEGSNEDGWQSVIFGDGSVVNFQCESVFMAYCEHFDC